MLRTLFYVISDVHVFASFVCFPNMTTMPINYFCNVFLYHLMARIKLKKPQGLFVRPRSDQVPRSGTVLGHGHQSENVIV